MRSQEKVKYLKCSLNVNPQNVQAILGSLVRCGNMHNNMQPFCRCATVLCILTYVFWCGAIFKEVHALLCIKI